MGWRRVPAVKALRWRGAPSADNDALAHAHGPGRGAPRSRARSARGSTAASAPARSSSSRSRRFGVACSFASAYYRYERRDRRARRRQALDPLAAASPAPTRRRGRSPMTAGDASDRSSPETGSPPPRLRSLPRIHRSTASSPGSRTISRSTALVRRADRRSSASASGAASRRGAARSRWRSRS